MYEEQLLRAAQIAPGHNRNGKSDIHHPVKRCPQIELLV